MSRIRTTKQATKLRAVVIQRRDLAFAACVMGVEECPDCQNQRARAFLATREQINQDERES